MDERFSVLQNTYNKNAVVHLQLSSSYKEFPKGPKYISYTLLQNWLVEKLFFRSVALERNSLNLTCQKSSS